MDEDIEMEDRLFIQKYKTFTSNKKYNLFHICNSSRRNRGLYENINSVRKISRVELRVKNDIIEFQTNRKTTGKYEINLSNYKLSKNGDECSMEVEFKNYFVINITFGKDYPFNPPEINYVSGSVSNVFDMEMKLKLPMLSKEEWKPILSLNNLLFEIELLLMNNENVYMNKYQDNNYQKKKMREYSEFNLNLLQLKENTLSNEIENDNQFIIHQMQNLKMNDIERYKY